MDWELKLMSALRFNSIKDLQVYVARNCYYRLYTLVWIYVILMKAFQQVGIMNNFGFTLLLGLIRSSI